MTHTGHGPFSHMYDELIKSEKEEDHPNWPTDKETIKLKAHEYRSAEILKKLLKNGGFWDSEPRLSCDERPQALTEEKDLKFIQDLITFSEDYKEAEDEKKFLDKKLSVSLTLLSYNHRIMHLCIQELSSGRKKNQLFLFEVFTLLLYAITCMHALIGLQQSAAYN